MLLLINIFFKIIPNEFINTVIVLEVLLFSHIARTLGAFGAFGAKNVGRKPGFQLCGLKMF